MIATQYERGNFWLRLKRLLTLGCVTKQVAPTNNPEPKPKRRSQTTTAFFEMP